MRGHQLSFLGFWKNVQGFRSFEGLVVYGFMNEFDRQLGVIRVYMCLEFIAVYVVLG